MATMYGAWVGPEGELLPVMEEFTHDLVMSAYAAQAWGAGKNDFFTYAMALTRGWIRVVTAERFQLQFMVAGPINDMQVFTLRAIERQNGIGNGLCDCTIRGDFTAGTVTWDLGANWGRIRDAITKFYDDPPKNFANRRDVTVAGLAGLNGAGDAHYEAAERHLGNASVLAADLKHYVEAGPTHRGYAKRCASTLRFHLKRAAREFDLASGSRHGRAGRWNAVAFRKEWQRYRAVLDHYTRKP